MSNEVSLSFIEQLQIVCKSGCTAENRPYLTGVSRYTETAILARPSCGMWNCPSCAARNAKRWIARIINHINRVGGEWYMFTLTAHEKWRGTDASLINLRQGWKKLYNRMREKFGVSSYVKVWEMHADSSFHLHGMVNRKIPKKWLKKNARQCGMGYQVDFHLVNNAGQVAGYISKYFLKSQEQGKKWQFPKGLRRIEASRDWTKLEDLNTDGILVEWVVNQTRECQLRVAAYYKSMGYKIVDTVVENVREKNIVTARETGKNAVSLPVDNVPRTDTYSTPKVGIRG